MTPGPIAVFPRTQPLIEGTLERRYKRFLSDVRLASTGEIVVAHCVNTGAMEGLTRPGTRVWLSEANNPKRKLAYTWELAEIDGQVLGVNTGLPNRLVHQLLQGGHLPWLAHYTCIKPEVKYGENSRVDFLLSMDAEAAAGNAARHYLEVKNCHLIYPDGIAYFPDCVSTRAAGHLEELARCLESGDCPTTAEVLFFAQMPAAQALRPSDLHDPAFAAACRRVAALGVRFSAIGVRHTLETLEFYGPIPVDLSPYPTAQHELWRAQNKVQA